MKAAVFTAPREIRLEEVPKPVPAEGEVLIRVKACGICGSDIPFYMGVPDPYCSFPTTTGHEIAGVVEQTAGDSKGILVGDKVVPEITVNCGECYACRIGKYNCCANLKIIGAHLNGGFAEYVLVPARLCHKLPAGMDLELAALCEPYSIGAQVAKRVGLTRDDRVVITGAGTIGLTILDRAKNLGAKVLISDIHMARLTRAKHFGADEIVDANNDNLLERVMRFTEGEGATVAIDATGVAAVINALPAVVASGGRLGVVGIAAEDVKIKGTDLIRKELSLFASRNSTNVFPSVIDEVYHRKVHAEDLITHRFRFDEIAAAFEHAVTDYDHIGKVVVQI